MVGVLVGARPGAVTTGDWIAWSQTNDATGRVRTDVTTFASAIATTAGLDPSTDAAAPVSTDPQIDVDHRYSYDKAGALVKVEDPKRHRDGNPVGGELFHERVEPCDGRFACER